MKFLTKKRIASAALTAALALSMAAPTFAANTASTQIDGSFQEVKLNVVVPSTGKLIINPYGLPYKLGDAVIKGEKITTGAALTIQNKSEVALDAQVAVTVTNATSGITLFDTMTKAYAEDIYNTGKEIKVTFEAFETTLTGESVTDTAGLNSKFAALKSSDAILTVTPNALDTACDSKLRGLANTDGTVTGQKLILREGNSEGNAQKGGIAFFRISGLVTQNAAWDTNDKFDVKLAWTFIPDVYQKNAGTITVAGASGNVVTLNGAATAALTLNWDQALTDAKIYPKSVTWSTSDSDVATATGTVTNPSKATATVTGTVTPVANGTGVTVTATVIGTDNITYVATSTDTITVTGNP